MRSEAASVRLRSSSAAFCRIVARPWRVSEEWYAAAIEKARRTSSTVAFGTVPASSPVNGLMTPMMRVFWSFIACDSSQSDPFVLGLAGGARRDAIQRDIENVEIAQASSFGDRRVAAEQQRHRLLAEAPVRAQRCVQPGQIVARAARAEDDVAGLGHPPGAPSVPGPLGPATNLRLIQCRPPFPPVPQAPCPPP